jgi:hypothetical protein
MDVRCDKYVVRISGYLYSNCHCTLLTSINMANNPEQWVPDIDMVKRLLEVTSCLVQHLRVDMINLYAILES